VEPPGGAAVRAGHAGAVPNVQAHACALPAEAQVRWYGYNF
jgi:hypothetical protein